MEKTKNKFYVAVAVLDFVFASIFVLYSLIMILTLSSGSFIQLVEESLAGEYGVGTPELAAQVEMIKTMWTGLTILMIASAAVMYVAGAYFLKYSNLTDHEADEKWGKCLAWTIVSYFFGGLLVGGLATAGLCSVQAKQRDRVTNVAANWTTSTGKTVDINTGNIVDKQEDALAPENLDKIRVRLEKLKELKDSGAISNEEFESLRAKTMAGLAPKKEEPKVNPEEERINKMTERLNKLKTLKDTGAISEEEYNNLRAKVIEESK